MKLPFLGVFGNDYLTKDGTGVRDYIHVVDLAIGYVAAVNVSKENKGLKIYNLGTGKGNSVLEVIETMKILQEKLSRINSYLVEWEMLLNVLLIIL